MAKQVLVRTHPRRVLEEILLRIQASQDTFEGNEIETILRNPRYRRALREAEADVKSGRERDFVDFVKSLSKKR